MMFAYADPPYPGMAHLYPEKTEVDPGELIARLRRDYPDGWALSTSSTSLSLVLGYCHSPVVRVMAWVKPFAVFKPNVGVAYAWEPVLVYGGRKRTREQPTVRDWVSANITLKTGTVGAKPLAFYHWLREVLNVQAGDELHDLYPGTGGLAQAMAQETLFTGAAPGRSAGPTA